jgi:hypothetical protein
MTTALWAWLRGQNLPADPWAAALAAAGVRAVVERSRRGQPGIVVRVEGGVTRVRVHALLADDPACAPLVAAWLAGRARRAPLRLTQLVDAAREAWHRQTAAAVTLTGIGDGPVDLLARRDRLAAAACPGMPLPDIRWARRTSGGRRRSIRYGTYYHPAPARPRGEVRIHPLLGEPWIAEVFLDHVIHHELCHHRQALEPVRGERVHGPRFRTWERAYAAHAVACRWERAHRPRLLAGISSGADALPTGPGPSG